LQVEEKSGRRGHQHNQFLCIIIASIVLFVISFFMLSMYQLWTSGSSDKNKGMVEQLERYGIIKSKRVKEVMEAIDRGLFVPAGSGSPYFDSPMPIGYNATISAPHMHATCLELLEKHLQPGMRALDVGSGSVFEYLIVVSY
jgi:Protein-L-isoaspartate(D-aspartate) O-methyltransferase (PCMT)